MYIDRGVLRASRSVRSLRCGAPLPVADSTRVNIRRTDGLARTI
jgi:hypothetical protein